MKLLLHNTLYFLILDLNLTMTKLYVSTVLHKDNDTNSYVDDLFPKLDISKKLSAKEASNHATATEASLGYSSRLYDYMSATESQNSAIAAAAKEALAKPEGLFSNLCLHLSSFSSPFNHGNIAPAGVPMDETPRTGITQHANELHDNLHYPIDEVMTFGGPSHQRPDLLAPVTASPTLTERTVNFKTTNNNDGSNTPLRLFHLSENNSG
jgi:hypothetical protein